MAPGRSKPTGQEGRAGERDRSSPSPVHLSAVILSDAKDLVGAVAVALGGRKGIGPDPSTPLRSTQDDKRVGCRMRRVRSLLPTSLRQLDRTPARPRSSIQELGPPSSWRERPPAGRPVSTPLVILSLSKDLDALGSTARQPDGRRRSSAYRASTAGWRPPLRMTGERRALVERRRSLALRHRQLDRTRQRVCGVASPARRVALRVHAAERAYARNELACAAGRPLDEAPASHGILTVAGEPDL